MEKLKFRNTILIAILFCTQFILNAQTTYEFDYLLEYDGFNVQDSTNTKGCLVLSNEKDNSYYLQLDDNKNLSFELYFYAFGCLSAVISISKEDFYKSESITIPCDYVVNFADEFKFRKKKTKNHKIIKLKDTLIANSSLGRYQTIYTKSKKKVKRKRSASIIFLTQESSNIQLPTFLSPKIYEAWKNSNRIMNGLITEKHFINKNEQLEHKRVLKSVTSISKKIIIPTDCSCNN